MWRFSISEDNVENAELQVISAHVAVKVIDSESSEDRVKFLQEVVLMGQFNDPNIMSVFGVVTKTKVSRKRNSILTKLIHNSYIINSHHS